MPSVKDNDRTCIIGSAGTNKKLNALVFTGANSDQGKGSNDPNSEDAFDRMREGYIEFIVMGYADPSTGIGKTIEDHNCAGVTDAFSEANILTTARQFGEPINALKFNFRLVHGGRGMEAGGQAVTWANFFNHLESATALGVASGPVENYPDGGATPSTNANCAIDRGAERRVPGKDWDPTTAAEGGTCRNLITAQELNVFLEPSLNDAFPRVGSLYDDMTNKVWQASETVLTAQGRTVISYGGKTEARGVDAFSATIQRWSVINEWVVKRSEVDAETEWVVTFPTKAFYVDKVSQVQAAIGSLATDSNTVARPETVYASMYTGATEAYAPFKEVFPGKGMSCSEVSFTVFDRDEHSLAPTPVGGIIDSPAPPHTVETDSLCYVTNVLKFSETSGVLGSDLAKIVNVSGMVQNKGWMELDLTVDAAAQTGLPLACGGTTKAFQGLPAIGFMMKKRIFRDPTFNYMTSIKHAYRRKK